MPKKVLFAGCGLTGSASSWLLQRALHKETITPNSTSNFTTVIPPTVTSTVTPPSIPAAAIAAPTAPDTAAATATAATGPPAVLLRFVEKNQHLGGRLACHHFRDPEHGLQGQVNLGGQYVTKYREAHSAVFDYLQRTGVIHSFDATSGIIEGVRKEYECLPHYVAPHGMEQIVRAFLSVEEQRHVRLSTHISAINIDSDQLLSVSCVSQDGLSSTIEKVNCLVMTMPPPAMFRHISGNFWQYPAMTTELTAALQAVSYSSRFALALYYRLPSVECERILQEQRWTARYVTDDPHIRYISLSRSTEEPGIASSSTKVSDRLAPASNANLTMLSVLVHSSISLYQDMHLPSNHNDSNSGHNVSSVETNVRSLSHAETGAVSTIMVQSLHRYLPSLQSLTPAYSQLSSWADSQVTVPFPSNFWDSLPSVDSANVSSAVKEEIPRHAVCVDVSKEARVIFAGDYFSSSNVEGCLDSAQQTADYILEFVSPPSLGQGRIGHL